MQKQIKILIALAVITLSIWFIARQPRAPKSLTTQSLYDTMSEVVAEEIVRAAPQGGEVVIWMYDGADVNPVLKLVLHNLPAALAKSTNLRLAGIEKLPVSGAGNRPTADQILALIQKHATAAVIVSFIGAPQLTAGQAQALGNQRPWFVVVDAVDSLDPAATYDPRLVKAAIVARSQPPTTAVSPTATPRELFDRSYEVLHPQ